MLVRTRIQCLASPYAVLGIREAADITPTDVKKAFRKKAAQLHPDVGGDEEQFKELCDAFNALLKRHGGARSDASSVSREETASDGRGFYDTPHARWANGSAGGYQKRYPFDHDHQTARHGEGLGEAFSREADWDTSQGRWRNHSTRHFYRPYQSDFADPFGHGFTPEEIEAAEAANRRARRRTILKHVCLWGGLLLVAASYRRQDRINRAKRARDGNYADPAYWASVDEERRRHRVLREGSLWWEKPLEPLWRKDEEDSEGDSRSGPPNRRATAWAASGPPVPLRAVTFRGRPFTPNGVRSPNVSLPKNQAAFAGDVSFEPEDADEGEW